MSQNFQETNQQSLQQNKLMNSMASSQLSIIFSILAIFVPLVLAKEYVVGDKDGWTIQAVDYEAWAKGKKFSVGDTLVFKYAQGAHNVIEVKEDEYTQCNPSPTAKTLTSGQDVVKLDAPGKRYFICGVGKHCELGKQKIAIDVGSSSSSSAPTSGPSASSPDASTTSESGSSDSSATKPGSDGSSESKPSAAHAHAPAPGPSNSAATIGRRYGWMVIMSGIVGFLMA